MTQPMRVGWRPAEPPLPPCAVAAWGETAARLLERVLGRARLDDLSGVWSGGSPSGRAGGHAPAAQVGDEGVVLIGAASALPWVDGVIYLGRHRDAPGLLFPTTELPDAPLDLVARIVRRRVEDGDLPVAVVPAGSPHPPASTRAPSPGGRRGEDQASSPRASRGEDQASSPRASRGEDQASSPRASRGEDQASSPRASRGEDQASSWLLHPLSSARPLGRPEIEAAILRLRGRS